MAVEGHVGVREVVHEQELVFPREVDQVLHVRGRCDRGRRVVRERHDHDLRIAGTNRLCDRLHAARGRRGDDASTRESRRNAVNRVRGCGNDDRVAALDQHPHHVSEALLCADRARDLGLGVELDPERAQIVLGDRMAQLRDAPARRVAVIRGLRGGLLQFRHRDLGRRDVRVAETEVDHVAPVTAQLALQLVDRREDVRRQVFDSAKLHFQKYCKESNGC